jgi:RNA-directed DNA polymerase
MEDMIQDFGKGNKRPTNPEYKNTTNRIERLRLKLRANGFDANVHSEMKTLHKLRQKMPSVIEQTENYKRLRYCRYADDFVCGVIGSYNDAVKIMQAIKQYLNKLNLELSPDKTGIDRATKSIEFLGYNLQRVKGKSRKVSIHGTHVTRRTPDKIKLSIPRHKVIEFCNKYGYGTWHTKKAKLRGKLITSSEAEIVATYNAELRGLTNYYHLADKVKNELNALFHLAHYSLFNTLTGKRKSKITKVLQSLKTTKGLALKYRYKDEWKVIEIFHTKHMNRTVKCIDQLPVTARFYQSGTELIRRMEAEICEYCGQSDKPVEVHHVYKLKELRSRKHLEFWEKVMIARNRKTMILCTECHQLLHKGKLPDKRYKPKKQLTGEPCEAKVSRTVRRGEYGF